MAGIFEEFNWLVDPRQPSFDHRTRSLEPLVHIRDLGDEVLVTADLPYVRKEDIQISLTEDHMEINARTMRSVTLECCGTVHSRSQFHAFKKVLSLPWRVRPEEAKARFSGGILEVRVPKKIVRRRIEIE